LSEIVGVLANKVLIGVLANKVHIQGARDLDHKSSKFKNQYL